MLRLTNYTDKPIAAVLPFNTFDRAWPRLAFGEHVSVGSEGWVFLQRFKNLAQSVSLMTTDEAIAGSLKEGH